MIGKLSTILIDSRLVNDNDVDGKKEIFIYRSSYDWLLLDLVE